MAPDLNSVPSSPRNQAQPSQTPSPPTSRRPSQMTGTPLLPGVTSSGTVQQDTTHVPLRHPRPLTAAELHLELEKEQEAVVNRLTRELSALRAQHSASVASTTSSSSAIDNTHPSTSSDAATTTHAPATHGHLIQGPTQYTQSRRHRSSSNLSARSSRSMSMASQGAAPAAVASPGTINPAAAVPVTGTSQASVDRARDAAGVRSRENSLAGVGMPMPSRSRAPSASPIPSPMVQQPGLHGTFEQASSYITAAPQSHRQSVSSTSSATTTTRQEEAIAARANLELARKENEMLVARVRELESMLRGRPTAPVGVTSPAIGEESSSEAVNDHTDGDTSNTNRQNTASGE